MNQRFSIIAGIFYGGLAPNNISNNYGTIAARKSNTYSKYEKREMKRLHAARMSSKAMNYGIVSGINLIRITLFTICLTLFINHNGT